MIGVCFLAHGGPQKYLRRFVMKPPCIKFLRWATCSGAIAFAFVNFAVAAAAPNAAADTLAVPEPAMLVLLGVGLSAVAYRVRSRRRP